MTKSTAPSRQTVTGVDGVSGVHVCALNMVFVSKSTEV